MKLGQFLGLLRAAKPQKRLAQLRRQHGRQRAAFGRLDAQRLDARGLSVIAHLIQQDRLSHTA